MSEKMRYTISFNVTDEIAKEFKTLCQKNGKTQSEALRDFVSFCVKEKKLVIKSESTVIFTVNDK